ncbi:MAG TPA: hypothetical protein VGD91_18935 [Trebonia sp.]
MLQDLAALAPPAIVCVAFLVGAWVIVRRELAPRRRARAQAPSGAAAGALSGAPAETLAETPSEAAAGDPVREPADRGQGPS